MADDSIGESGEKNIPKWRVVDEETLDHHLFHVRKSEPARFVAWDGEGITDEDGTHRYILWGSSDGARITDHDLGTVECLNLLLLSEMKYPKCIHVIFAGTYDVNMILKDVPLADLFRIRSGKWTTWNGYQIQFRQNKWFRIRRQNVTVTLWDVFTFFAASFVAACREYLGDDETLTEIEAMKSERSNFSQISPEHITAYWEKELLYLVRLMDRLRSLFIDADIPIRSWHGPGSVASAILKRQKMHTHNIRQFDDDVSLAIQHAFAGGRFEQFKFGVHPGTVYEYDIRSAYPAAMATLPSMRNAQFVREHIDGRPDRVPWFGLYKVHQHPSADIYQPQPFFHRYKNGAVFYPDRTLNWYWGPEVNMALAAGYDLHISDCLIIHDDGERPFTWVQDMYEQRAAWKREGIPAQLALKLGLNSLYGKMAQQKGWVLRPDGTLHIPEWHNLVWAGLITSITRAKLFAAIMNDPTAIVACETDAVFSTRPLPLTLGPGLGEWEQLTFDTLMYIQSGLYFPFIQGEGWLAKTRGFNRGSVTADQAMQFLRTRADISIPTTRFHTMGRYLGKPTWRRWITEPRTIHIDRDGKRRHSPDLCPECIAGRPYDDVLHPMHFTVPPSCEQLEPWSYPYPLEWKDKRTAMAPELTEQEEVID